MERVGWMPFEEFHFRPELSQDYTVDAHWALYCENYLEGFHIPFVHAGLNAVIDYGKYSTELYKFSNLQLGLARENDTVFEFPPSSPDYGKKRCELLLLGFPKHDVQLLSVGIVYQRYTATKPIKVKSIVPLLCLGREQIASGCRS
jgi:hypothetical protein